MQKTKPARGKGYIAGSSCITNIVRHHREAKIHLDLGTFCTCVGNDYLHKTYTNGQDRQVKNVIKEKFVSDQFIEAQIIPELTPEIKKELIEILFQYKEDFASDNEPLGAIKGHEVEIMLNLERPYPQLLRRPAYPASHRARESLESHINELRKLGVLRKVGHNEEVKVTAPVIITWHNDNSRMVGYLRH
ncbi:hypothetical protein O181_088225 [Austropuccinia psidii MF-1]|uniref:Uncharacterized protein n=1 Tax=Austropuccinia psidii MF-1 TaxID=1389203 RepID=A0A9Q3P3I4_9BASI|nr:hypothetical protein [Austropuccinia psidii MF-1]